MLARLSRMLNVSSGRQDAASAALEHETCKLAGCVGPRVDVDAIISEIRPVGRRVPVNYDLAEILLGIQERRPNPDEILGLLLLQSYAGPHARVTEEIAAYGGRIG